MSPETDPFVGEILETKVGAYYKILSDNGLKGSSRKYLIHCSNCSNDNELFKELWSRKGDILRGKLCCGCSGNYKYSKEQYEILCKRQAKTIGAEFIGLQDYTGYKTKLIFEDPFGELQSNMSVEYFLRRYNPYSERKSLKGVPRKTESEYSDILVSRLGCRAGTKFRRIYDSNGDLVVNRISMFCPVCHDNPLCKSGITSPWFDTSISNLYKNSRPCFCSPVYRYSQEEYSFKVDHILKEESCGTFIEILEPFAGNSSRFMWECTCGSIRQQKIADFLAGKRCSDCAESGFKYDIPASLYVVLWESCKKSFLKVGITNRSVDTRVMEQQKHTLFIPTKVLSVDLKTGAAAKALETMLLKLFDKDESITKDMFPDGYTELLKSEYLEKVKEVVENYAINN